MGSLPEDPTWYPAAVASSSRGPDGRDGAVGPACARVQWEWWPGGVEVGDEQSAARPGHPVHLAERRLPPACGDVMDRQRAGDDVERGIREVGDLSGAGPA